MKTAPIYVNNMGGSLAGEKANERHGKQCGECRYERGERDEPLSFETFQAKAKKTAIYNQDARVMYPALGLAGEVGEFIEKAGGITAGVDVLLNGVAVCAGKCANQVKKIIRDDDCECDTSRKHAIGKEIGGVLWYCAAIASDLGLDLGDIAQENLDVLADRQKRGTIQGDGDNR